MVRVYHASVDDFDEFRVTEQGIHFGSIESAYEAVLRKMMGQGDDNYFYLYTIDLDTASFIDEYDQGYDWRRSFEREPDTVKGYVYMNRYEPSTQRSYVTWDTDVIIRIVDKQMMNMV